MIFKILMIMIYVNFAFSNENKNKCALFENGTSCHLSSSIDIANNVTSIEECQTACRDNENCEYFTFDASESSFCLLFDNCDDREACQDCLSGPAYPDYEECLRTCDDFKESLSCPVMSLIAPYHGIESVSECQNLCRENEDCRYFTYDKVESLECFLFSDCNVTYACATCTSGPMYPDYDSCFQVDGDAVWIVGGYGNTQLDEIEVFDGAKQCIHPANIYLKANGLSAAVLNEEVLVCGGFDGTNRLSNCCFANSTSCSPAPSMNIRRSFFGLVSIQDKFVAVGGYDGGFLTSVETLSFGENEWVIQPDWALPTAIDQGCVLAVDDTIYVVGGQSNNEVSRDNLLAFNITTEIWTELSPLNSKRFKHSCVLHNQNGQYGILVAGNGYYGNSELTSEFYDFSSNTWQELNKLNLGRHSAGMAIWNGKPSIFGGISPITDTIEQWGGQEWVLANMTMNQGKGYLAALNVPKSIFQCP